MINRRPSFGFCWIVRMQHLIHNILLTSQISYCSVMSITYVKNLKKKKHPHKTCKNVSSFLIGLRAFYLFFTIILRQIHVKTG